MAAEPEIPAVLAARHKLWDRLSSSLRPGATARAKIAAEQVKEQAEVAKPKPPDPREVIVAAWIAGNPAGFAALHSLMDEQIGISALKRRDSVASHSAMAFHEGETAALEQLRTRLMKLSGQA